MEVDGLTGFPGFILLRASPIRMTKFAVWNCFYLLVIKVLESDVCFLYICLVVQILQRFEVIS